LWQARDTNKRVKVQARGFTRKIGNAKVKRKRLKMNKQDDDERGEKA